jgi:predicted DNA-binding transcriptional regulator AlpA
MDHTKFADLPDSAILRLSVMKAWGLIPFSASTMWRLCRSGKFPEPVKVSQGVTGWRAGDVREWLHAPATYLAKNSARQAQDGKNGGAK